MTKYNKDRDSYSPKGGLTDKPHYKNACFLYRQPALTQDNKSPWTIAFRLFGIMAWYSQMYY